MAANNEVVKCGVTSCPNDARPGRRTCSPVCAQLWRETYRFVVDKEATNRNQANTILRHPEKYNKARRDWAERVLGVEVGRPIETPNKSPAISWLKEQIATRDRSEGCWEWPFGQKLTTYFQGQYLPTPAVSLILDGNPRPDPPYHFSLHSCDNPKCVNPAHLRWGTHQDNMDDMVERERQARGESHGNAKLTDADIVSIRKDTRSLTVVAKAYGVDRSLVSMIRNKKIWTHV